MEIVQAAALEKEVFEKVPRKIPLK